MDVPDVVVIMGRGGRSVREGRVVNLIVGSEI